jgi:phosphoribosyl-ATP pyrophosphohydrolase
MSTHFDFLTTLESVITLRRSSTVAGSYTASLFAAGPRRIAQKVGEEAVELALAAVDGSRGEIVDEAADLVFHLLVLLNSQDIALADVVAALENRHTPA